MTGVVKVKGIKLDFSGRRLVVPPLSLGALEQLQERLNAFNGDIADPDQVRTVIDSAHAALRRNYPDMTRAEVADAIGLENMLEVMQAVMDVSGMKRKEIEAAALAGGSAPGEG